MPKPSIIDRVSKQAPFAEDLPESVRPKVKEEPNVEIPVEQKVETEGMVEDDGGPTAKEDGLAEKKAEPTEEVALANSKNPERTKEYIDKLKAETETVKAEARKFANEGPVATLVPEPKQDFDWSKMLVNTAPPATLFPNLTTKEVKNVMGDLVDEQGYVNTDLLRETLDNANKAAADARTEAQQARREAQQSKRTFDDYQRSQVAKEVHGKFPELNPDSDTFNPEYFKAVRNEVLANTFEGKPEGFLKAAEDLHERFSMKKADKAEVKEQQDAVAQINATGGSGKSHTRRPFGETEALISAVRKGVKGSLGERLKRAGL